MKRTLLFVLALAIIPVGVDAQVEVDDPDVLRYEVICLCAKNDLDEDLVRDLLETKLRAGGITPVRHTNDRVWTVPMLGVYVQKVGGGWAHNVHFLREVSYQVRGQTLRTTAATDFSVWPIVAPRSSEEDMLRHMGVSFDQFVEAFRSANGLEDGN